MVNITEIQRISEALKNKGFLNMTKKNEIYKCNICGNVVEVVENGGGNLICCGQSMIFLEEQTAEKEGNEKHVPVVETEGSKVKVKVGSIAHPMEKKHYIEMIEILKGDTIIASAQLRPGQKPEAEFCLENTDGIRARALCNVHWLWVS